MTILIPNGQPNRRFMRYVRPPIQQSDTHSPLFPLRPASRPLRLGIDVATVPAVPAGYLARFLDREEIEVHLMVQADSEVPPAWSDALPDAATHRLGFTSVENASRMGDTVQFWITTESPRKQQNTRAYFFDVYQRLDADNAPQSSDPPAIDQRHRAAAYAAGAAKVGIDVIVTNAATVGRADVADNDVVASVTPEEAVALIGHYLRMTANPVVNVRHGAMLGGGSWQATESTATLKNLYDWGVVSAMPYFEFFEIIAKREADSATVNALESIRARISRAARALDHMLAALSNPVTGPHGPDVIETVAEAFDRELLYLAAAFDIYGRRYPLLVDPSRSPIRQSLDGKGYLRDFVNKEYDPEVLTDVSRLHVYASICKVLRNHIHDGILPVDQHPGRNYGNSLHVALNLDAMPELHPESDRRDKRLEQVHYDALGVWRTDPVEMFAASTMVADLATAGVALLSAGLAFVEEFTKLILRNKPKVAAAPSPILGWVEPQPGEAKLQSPEGAVFHQALFGWHRGAEV